MKNSLLPVASLLPLAALVFLSVSSTVVTADEYSKSGGEMMMMGEHDMGGTIQTINHKTGWMKLKTGIGEMTIHYPPASIMDLKKGDKITAHLSYTKQGGKMDDDRMKRDDKMMK